jgi:DNA-binding GntR family transcriptional regulator
MAKIETSLLTKQVYDVLRTKIIDGAYRPGDKLDIHKLSDEFGVSRSPVKDAINQLVYDGLIEIIPRKGTYVTEVDITSFLETLDARLMVELWAANRVIQHISATQVEKLRQIVQQMDVLLEETPFPFQKYNKLDLKFHAILIEWAGNATIGELFSSLNTHVALSRIVISTSLESTTMRHPDHWDLFHAMKDRDLPAFSSAITRHIESLKKEAADLFEDGE